MAYSAKYRMEFKDIDDVDIKVDILEDGFGGSVTSVTPTSDPLTISWPGERGDIFNPVRGAVCDISFYATSAGQFNEFFNSNTLQYKIQVYYDGSVYWSGFPILSDYSESLLPAPYPVNIKAYDLGFLQHSTWDISVHGDEELIYAIQLALADTNLSLNLKERMSMREDSQTQTTSASTLDETDIHLASFIDETWNGITMYEALKRMLLPFNAFIMQENNVWNLCRVADMGQAHHYRQFNTSGVISSNGAEDLRSSLSNYYQLDTNSVLLSSPNYRKLNITRNQGFTNLVNNGNAVNTSPDPLDYWNRTAGNGSIDYVTRTVNHGYPSTGKTITNINAIELDSLVSQSTYEHETTYALEAGTRLDVSYYYEIHSTITSPTTATQVTIEIELDDGAGNTYYLDWTDGSWDASSSVSDITFTSSSDYIGGTSTIQSDEVPIASTLTIRLIEANWSSFVTGGNTYFKLSVEPSIINDVTSKPTKDLSETIDANSVEDSEEITFYYGDAADTDSKDILLGSLLLSSTGAATDSWQSLIGSIPGTLLDLAIDCYQVQYETSARRIQALLKGDLDYLTVLTDSSDRNYLATSITRNFADSTLDGEWVEIKVGYGDDILGTVANAPAVGYDTFSQSTNTLTLEKTQTSTSAACNLTGTSVTAGTKYKVVATVAGAPLDSPTVTFAGSSFTASIGQTTTEYITAATTTSTHNDFVKHPLAADTFNGTVEIYIYEAIGL